jgi:hypothetical protein
MRNVRNILTRKITGQIHHNFNLVISRNTCNSTTGIIRSKVYVPPKRITNQIPDFNNFVKLL